MDLVLGEIDLATVRLATAEDGAAGATLVLWYHACGWGCGLWPRGSCCTRWSWWAPWVSYLWSWPWGYSAHSEFGYAAGTGLLWVEVDHVGHQLGLARGLLWAHPDQNWPRDTELQNSMRPIPLLIQGQNGYTTHIMLLPICIQSNCRGASPETPRYQYWHTCRL